MNRKIVGNPVGIPNPISDMAQTDPTKADYVKNKKLSYMEDDVGYAKTFIVNVAINKYREVTADKTAFDIRKAYESGQQVILKHTTKVTELNELYDIYYMQHFYYDDDLGNIGFTFCNLAGNRIKLLEHGNSGDWHSSSYTIATKNDIDNIETALENKADKPIIINVNEPTYAFEFSELYNCVVRMGSAESISFTFGDGEYPNIYMSSLSFDSGETPTAIDYTGSGILNWVGVDCVNNDGLSIFQPSANKHYDIVFDFNGTQFIGLVNGFVPATGNVVSE